MTAEEEEAGRKQILAELEAMLMGIGSDKADSQRSDEEDAAEVEKSMSDIKTVRVSAEEAEKLDDLGRELGDIELAPDRGGVEPEPNQFEDDVIESDANLSEPDSDESDFNESDFNESDFNESDFNEPDFNELDFNEPNLD